MSSRIDLPIRPSHPLAILCALPWLLLTALVAVMATDHGAMLLLVAPALLGAVLQYRRSGLLKGKRAVTGLRIAHGHLYARLNSGEVHRVVPAGESRLSAGFAILKLRPVGFTHERYSVVLIALTTRLCNTSPEAFRQLRVRFRLGPAFTAPAAGGQQPLESRQKH